MKILTILTILFLTVQLFGDFQFGKILFEDELYEEAIAEFEKVIETKPTSQEAIQSLFHVGLSYEKLAKNAKAYQTYQRIITGYENLQFKDKVLFHLIKAAFKIKKFDRVIHYSQQLKEAYPVSDFTEKSFEYYLRAFLEQKKYEKTILKAEQIIANYAESSQIEEVYYLLALAYKNNNQHGKSKEVLNKIFNNYPATNAYWKARLLFVELLKIDKGLDSAIASIKETLEEGVPRFYEEEFLRLLVDFYTQQNNFNKAEKNLEKLISKYNNSIKLADYIVELYEIQIKLKHYNKIIESFDNYQKIFKESPKQDKYNYLYAFALYKAGNLKQANAITTELTRISTNDSILFETKMLKANILNSEGKLIPAINVYNRILNQAVRYDKKNKINWQIGNIYLHKLNNYSAALNYYRQIDYTDTYLKAKAIYNVAVCYEKMNNYKAAIDELNQINLKYIADNEFKEKIEQKRTYLNEFKLKHYDKALDSMLKAFLHYFKDKNETEIKNKLFDIYSQQLKEYETSLEFLENDTTQTGLYKKGKIYLKIIRKWKMQSDIAKVERYGSKFQNILANITNATYKNELELKHNLIEQEQLTESSISQLDSYISSNPNSKAADEFRMKLIKHYMQTDETEKAVAYIEEISDKDNISRQDYYQAKIALAEFYFNRDKPEKALGNYKDAEAEIELNKPDILFHYGVVLNETGYTEKAIERLTFLVNNTSEYSEIDEALRFLANIFRNQDNYEKAVKFMNEVDITQRDDEFYRILAQDYLNLNDKENAKVNLMHIKDKSNNILSQLADLQFQTGDYELAKYSYKQLIDKNENKLKANFFLGHIFYLQEDYDIAYEYYAKLATDFVNQIKNFDKKNIFARELINSLYHLQNRPRAEKYFDEYEDYLLEKDIFKIRLAEGIYYLENDVKEAEDIFEDLIDEDNLPVQLRYEAYFWQGVAFLKLEETTKAEKSFELVLNSDDKDLQNKANLKLGTINFTAENYEKALEYYFQVIKNDKDGNLAMKAANNYAYVCKTIKEWQKAIAAYEIILEKWGDKDLEANTVFDIAFCHYRDKKYLKAIEMFQKSINSLNDDKLKAEAQYWIGDAYFGLENYKKAITEFLKVGYNYSALTRWAASAELKAAEAYQKSGENNKAIKLYDRIIKKYGRNSQWGEQAVKRKENL